MRVYGTRVQVLPKSYGQRLPWWFLLDRRSWAQQRIARAAAAVAAAKRRLEGEAVGASRSWTSLQEEAEAGEEPNTPPAVEGAQAGMVQKPFSFSYVRSLNYITTCAPPLPHLPLNSRGHGQGVPHHRWRHEAGRGPPEPAGALQETTAALLPERSCRMHDMAPCTGRAVSPQVEAGRITALLGHNGAGEPSRAPHVTRRGHGAPAHRAWSGRDKIPKSLSLPFP